MFSSGPNYGKLKTNLRLAINRLRLLGKKKAELARKSQKEIADYIKINKVERAKIRVEYIIREDYLVEAMELVEMYCDLVLARFGLVTQMTEMDDGLVEAISSLLWVAPRLQADVQELKIVSDLLTAKYGQEYANKCRSGEAETINEKLKHKMSVSAPPKKLVEKYMVEIAKNFGIEYEPDPEILKDESVDSLLDFNNLDKGGPPQPMGFIGFPQPPMLPTNTPFNYPPMHPGGPGGSGGSGGFTSPTSPDKPMNIPYGAPYSYNIPPNDAGANHVVKDLNTENTFMLDDNTPPPYYDSLDDNSKNINANIPDKPKPEPGSKFQHPGSSSNFVMPELPNVPSDLNLPEPPKSNDDDIDFDDLSRRFQELKKKP